MVFFGELTPAGFYSGCDRLLPSGSGRCGYRRYEAGELSRWYSFVAATMAIGSMSNAVGVAGLVSELMMPILQNVGNFGLILFAWLTGVITDMMMTPLAGMAAFSPLFIDIAAKLGLSVVGTTFSFRMGRRAAVFPYEWALFLILFSYDVFDMKKAMKFCTVRTILSIIFLMVLIYPYWMMTGFLR